MKDRGLRRCLLPCLAAALLAACARVPVRPPEGPVVARIALAERGWHTDICLSAADADAWVRSFAAGFPGTHFLCLGFGERQYVVDRQHDVLTMASALLPSRSALLLTALNAPPAAAFGAANVVGLGVSRVGLAGLQAFLRQSTQADAVGRPLRLANGPYPGSAFFAATGTYDGFYTCNTWAADALRAARLPISGGMLFSGDLMDEARRLAAAQARNAS